MRLELNQTEQGVCPIVVVILGRREIGKTTLMQATAPLLCSDRRKLEIVSPLPTLKARMPDLKWSKISVTNKAGIDKLFRGWMEAKDKNGVPVQRFILADEADELTAANAAGTAGGFVSQAVYDYINYGREQGLGIMLSSATTGEHREGHLREREPGLRRQHGRSGGPGLLRRPGCKTL